MQASKYSNKKLGIPPFRYAPQFCAFTQKLIGTCATTRFLQSRTNTDTIKQDLVSQTNKSRWGQHFLFVIKSTQGEWATFSSIRMNERLHHKPSPAHAVRWRMVVISRQQTAPDLSPSGLICTFWLAHCSNTENWSFVSLGARPASLGGERRSLINEGVQSAER